MWYDREEIQKIARDQITQAVSKGKQTALVRIDSNTAFAQEELSSYLHLLGYELKNLKKGDSFITCEIELPQYPDYAEQAVCNATKRGFRDFSTWQENHRAAERKKYEEIRAEIDEQIDAACRDGKYVFHISIPDYKIINLGVSNIGTLWAEKYLVAQGFVLKDHFTWNKWNNSFWIDVSVPEKYMIEDNIEIEPKKKKRRRLWRR